MSNSNGRNLLVSGRILWTSGDLFAGKPKVDDRTRQPVIDLKTGLQVIEYGFGLAVLKVDPATGQYTEDYTKAYQALHGEALTLYPSGVIPPAFALKYKDGDKDVVKETGVPYSTKEGYANHIVIACTTRIPIKFYQWDGQANVQVNSGFKNGDYVKVQLNIVAHPSGGPGQNAGLYTNPAAVQFLAAGQAIINAPSGDQMFGTNTPVYQGQIIAPTIGAMPNVGGMPGAPAAPVYAPQPPVYAPAPAAPVYAPPAPHYEVLPAHHQPAPAAPVYAPQPPVYAPAPAAPVYAPAPGGMPAMPPR